MSDGLGVDVRESMKVLPKAMQPFLTWMSGKPLRDQQPLWKSNSFLQTAGAITSLLGGAALAAGALAKGPGFWPLIVLAWLFIVGGARKIQVTISHQCAHFNFSGSKFWDRLISEALSTLIMVDHFQSYFHEHVKIHHTKQLASAVDPDCKFLLELGFRPGMSKNELWGMLLKTMISPVFHGKFLWARFRSNFISGSQPRRAAAMWFHAILLTSVAVFGLWKEIGICWFFPLTALYHVAALLNFTSLHFWLKPQSASKNAQATLCELTAGRFVGERVPSAELKGYSKWKAWSVWGFRMIFVHLPVRIAVLPGDLPVHDYHHRHPKCSDWANYLYTRQRDIEKGCPGFRSPYLENWGLKNAIDAVFDTLSTAPRLVEMEKQPFLQNPIRFMMQM